MQKAPQLSEEELNMVYNWVDEIPLSRPKRNISRDFSDGVLIAEIVNHFRPNAIELHNYSQANSLQKKKYNWDTLNAKVFKKMGFQVHKQDIDSIINAQPEIVERVLYVLIDKIQNNGSGSQYRQTPSNMPYQQNGGQQQQQMGGGVNQQQMQQMLQQQQNQNQIIWEKDQNISELRETVDILEIKIKKLEDFIKLKDNKILNMQKKMQEHGIL